VWIDAGSLDPMPRREPQGADSRWRYLVAFSDGGSGPRFFDDPLEVGDELRDGGVRYRVAAVCQPPGVGRGGGTAFVDLVG
jgi:hypothetical protein